MAVWIDLTFAFIAESFASCEYPESARKPMVAKIARIVMTTMSSTRVNADNFLVTAAARPNVRFCMVRIVIYRPYVTMKYVGINSY